MKGGDDSSQGAACQNGGPSPKVLGSEASPPPPREVPAVLAVEIIRRMHGGSQPFLVRCDDGHTYVVKFTNNPQHFRILANEMLASRLATLIGLPVPFRAFVEVSSNLVSGNTLLKFEMGARQEPC